MEKQTTFLDFDGKQSRIIDFIVDNDDDGNSYEAMYRKMGVNQDEPP